MKVPFWILSPQVSDKNTFGDSWVVSTEDCEGPTEDPDNPCDTDDNAVEDAHVACFGFIDPDGT